MEDYREFQSQNSQPQVRLKLQYYSMRTNLEKQLARLYRLKIPPTENLEKDKSVRHRRIW